MRIRSVWNLSAFFAVLLVAHTAQVHAVYKGITVTSGGGANGIFMASFQRAPFEDGTPKPVQLAGTVTNVEYKRCFLTAKHIAQADDFATDIFKGDDLQTITNAVPRQRIVKRKSLPSDGPALVYRDIGVVFVEGLLEGDDGVKRLVNADYAKWNIDKAETLGLVADAADLAVADGKKLRMVGYGHDRYDAPFPETPEAKTDMGIGKKRAGFPNAVALIEAGNGAWIKALPVAADLKRTACAGDSGSPLQSDAVASTVYGVLSGSAPGHCEERADDYIGYAALTDPAAEGENSNWKQVNRLINEVCVKNLEVGVQGVDAGGSVVGTLSPGHQWPPLPNPDPDPSFDDDVACGAGVATQDCQENMHEGQVMSLTATPYGSTSQFSHWSATAGRPCPCVTSGLNNPACDVDYEDMGYYTTGSSIDASHCVANFIPISSSSSAMSSVTSSSPPASSQPSSVSSAVSSVTTSASSASSASSLSTTSMSSLSSLASSFSSGL